MPDAVDEMIRPPRYKQSLFVGGLKSFADPLSGALAALRNVACGSPPSLNPFAVRTH